MKKILYIFSILCLFFSCDSIDDNNRYLDKGQGGNDTATFVKNVLLEDFTGQQCINCPAAALEAKRLQDQYDGRLIIVGIHAGNQSRPIFHTEAGNAYREFFYPQGDGAQGGYPGGMTDRTSINGSIVSNIFNNWADMVKLRMETEAKLGLSLISHYDKENNSIVITSTLSAASVIENIKLQLLVVENDIIAYQIGRGDKYVHDHVLRGAVNGVWGEDVVTKVGDRQYISAVYKLEEGWVPKNMRVVGFVYDAQTKEVLQAAETELMGTEPVSYIKNVLLEDFTGQQCINCPAAALEAKRLQDQYDGRLVIVGIHAGNQSRPIFHTEAGNAYREFFYPQGDGAQGGYPGGMTDRTLINGSIVSNIFNNWADMVKLRMEMEAKLGLSLISRYDKENNSIVVTSTLSASSVIENIKLQLLVVESGIIAYQIGRGENYVHNHVLRGAVNGVWGQDVVTKVGEMQYVSAAYKLDKGWMPENMWVVGFVYNAQTKEVLQVNEVEVIHK